MRTPQVGLFYRDPGGQSQTLFPKRQKGAVWGIMATRYRLHGDVDDGKSMSECSRPFPSAHRQGMQLKPQCCQRAAHIHAMKGPNLRLCKGKTAARYDSLVDLQGAT